MTKYGTAILFAILAFIILIILYTLLVMLIWNGILVKKFPSANMKVLTFWEAMALAVFFSVMTGGGVSINNQNQLSFFGYKFM